jgi:hypothetical protein
MVVPTATQRQADRTAAVQFPVTPFIGHNPGSDSQRLFGDYPFKTGDFSESRREFMEPLNPATTLAQLTDDYPNLRTIR